jgi:hypothetical protein
MQATNSAQSVTRDPPGTRTRLLSLIGVKLSIVRRLLGVAVGPASMLVVAASTVLCRALKYLLYAIHLETNIDEPMR